MKVNNLIGFICIPLASVLALSACGGGSASGIEAPSSDEALSGAGDGTALTTTWAPADSDWYLYGASSMQILAEETGYSLTVQESGGSEANAIRMEQGDADIGMLDVQGAEAALGADHPLQAMYPISETLWQYVVAKDSGITSLEGLEGTDWNPGPVGGGSTQITIDLLAGMDIQPNYYEATLSDAVSAYTGRQIVGFSYRGAGTRATGAVLEASSARPIDLVAFTDEEIARASEINPALVSSIIPGGTYESVPEDTQTVGYWGVIVGAHQDLDQETVYTLTKAFWENIGTVQEQLPQTEGLTPEAAVKQGVLEFHPGAVQYYEEIGIDVPNDLVGSN